LSKFHAQLLGGRSSLRSSQQFRHVIDADDLGEAARGGQCGVAAAGGNVQHALVGFQVHGFAQAFAHDDQGVADAGVIAGRPGFLLAGFDDLEIGLNGLRLH
jgi:hypothetical protein